MVLSLWHSPAIVIVHPVHLMNVAQCRAAAFTVAVYYCSAQKLILVLGSTDSTWVVGCAHHYQGDLSVRRQSSVRVVSDPNVEQLN